jgi:hypothetical protein
VVDIFATARRRAVVSVDVVAAVAVLGRRSFIDMFPSIIVAA